MYEIPSFGATKRRVLCNDGAIAKAVEKVESHITGALNKGAKGVLGDKRSALVDSFFAPTVPPTCLGGIDR